MENANPKYPHVVQPDEPATDTAPTPIGIPAPELADALRDIEAAP
jgi:hypothetical protein